jgi:hypothetical protein
MKHETSPSHTHRVWIAGDAADARRACREFTLRGLCVAIQPVDYIFTMGAESGVCVTLINYPRFPASAGDVEAKAIELGHHLCEALHQGSFSVEGPGQTHWFSHRDQDQPIT